jgi:SAM-dependent methyltransferase
MNRFLHGMVRAVAETFHLPEPILEIGAYQVEGQEQFANLRELFPGRSYVGLDMRAGPGVDLVGNVEALPLDDASVGTVLSVSTFEHVRRFWRGFDEVRRVLRPDGAFLVTCPFYFKIHQFPDDYWRFTPSALESLLENYPHKLIGWHGARQRPANVWALAFREQHTPNEATQYDQYRRLLDLYAHEPRSWNRRMRYGLARLLCGRGPFAPYLDHDRWGSQCRMTPP